MCTRNVLTEVISALYLFNVIFIIAEFYLML